MNIRPKEAFLDARNQHKEKNLLHIYSVMQSDGISFENLQFSKGYNFCTKHLILILKTSTCPYSCLAKVIICSVFV